MGGSRRRLSWTRPRCPARQQPHACIAPGIAVVRAGPASALGGRPLQEPWCDRGGQLPFVGEGLLCESRRERGAARHEPAAGTPAGRGRCRLESAASAFRARASARSYWSRDTMPSSVSAIESMLLRRNDGGSGCSSQAAAPHRGGSLARMPFERPACSASDQGPATPGLCCRPVAALCPSCNGFAA